MRKYLLSIILVSFVFVVQAQSFSFLGEGDEDISGTIVAKEGATSEEIVFEFEVKNNTSNAVTVKVEIIPQTTVEGSWFQMCVPGACIFPNATLSPGIAFTANEIKGGFSLHYKGLGNVGTSTYKLKVFNVDDPSDEVFVTVVFKAEESAVEDNFGKILVSDIYPNPATNQANIEYNLSFGSHLNVVMYDMLGKEVKRYNLESSGVLSIPVGELERGTYFCRYILDDKIVETQKLIVR